MDWRERLRLLPPDGTMPMVTELKDFKSNIMIIKCPDHLRSSPDDEWFHLATVDRSVVSTNYSGNDILDKLCPGLPKVKLPRRIKPKTGSPPLLPPPVKKYAAEQRDVHSDRRGNRFSSGSRGRPYHKNLWIERPDKSWMERPDKSWMERPDKSWMERPDKSWMERSEKSRIERSEKSRIERTDKSWSEWPMRTNPVEISPWEEGKQPWNNTLGNLNVPIFDVSRNIDFQVTRPVNDIFVPHKDILPLPPDYSRTSGVFHGGPSPNYPACKGLRGNHPLETDPGYSYRNHNPTGDPLSNTFPSGSRDPGIGNNYRNSIPRNRRGNFQKNNRFKRKPCSRRGETFANNEKNSEASTWNGDEGARLINRTQGHNRNRQRKLFNTGNQNYRPREKY